MNFTDRLIHAWNAFQNKDPTPASYIEHGYFNRPDRRRLSPSPQTVLYEPYPQSRFTLDIKSASFILSSSP